MMDFNMSQKPDTSQNHSVAWSKTNTQGNATQQKTSSLPKWKELPRSKRNVVKWVFFVCIAVVLLCMVRATYRHIVYAGIDTTRYQAVYLTNDNVYFGKVEILVNGDIFLTDVFRVQAAATTSNAQEDNSSSSTGARDTGASTGDIRLVKPGKELHAPDDTMLIQRRNVLFVENLKTDGTVTKAIVDYHKQNTSQ